MDKASGTRMLVRTLFRSVSAAPLQRTCCRPPLRAASQPQPRILSMLARTARPFSSSSAVCSDDKSPSDIASSLQGALSSLGGSNPTTRDSAAPPPPPPAPPRRNMMEGLADLLPSANKSGGGLYGSAAGAASSPNAALGQALGGLSGLPDSFSRMQREVDESTSDEYHFTVYSHKHNTHITVSKPDRDVIVSMSTGNLGFRKANRGSYDAAYQLGAYVCDRLYQRGWHHKIQKMDVSLRGYGQGREAVTKILLGTEGRLLRPKITSVADTTRLKIGGTRSPRPRRLG